MHVILLLMVICTGGFYSYPGKFGGRGKYDRGVFYILDITFVLYNPYHFLDPYPFTLTSLPFSFTHTEF